MGAAQRLRRNAKKHAEDPVYIVERLVHQLPNGKFLVKWENHDGMTVEPEGNLPVKMVRRFKYIKKQATIAVNDLF